MARKSTLPEPISNPLPPADSCIHKFPSLVVSVSHSFIVTNSITKQKIMPGIGSLFDKSACFIILQKGLLETIWKSLKE